SSQHVYKTVEGINAKISHLAEVDGRLVAAGLEGVFEITGLKATPIMQIPTRYIYASKQRGTVIAATYDDAVWSLRPSADGWETVNLIADIGDQIEYVFEGAAD